MTVESRGLGFACYPFHAHTSTYVPEDVRGRSGDALVQGSDGGALGITVPSSPLWVVGQRFLVL